jgi:hypothetical protein
VGGVLHIVTRSNRTRKTGVFVLGEKDEYPEKQANKN